MLLCVLCRFSVRQKGSLVLAMWLVFAAVKGVLLTIRKNKFILYNEMRCTFMAYSENKKIYMKVLSLCLMTALVLALGCFGFTAHAQETEEEVLTHGYLEYVIRDNVVWITGYTGDGGDVSIPNMIDDLSVLAIETEAFWYEDKITAVDLPDYLEFIGDRAFQNCSMLNSVTIPDSVKEIGTAAFAECYALESVNIPKDILYVGGGAFDNTLWIKRFEDNTSIIFGGKVFYRYMGDASVVNIPYGVVGISGNAFTDNQKVTYVNIPETVLFVGDYSFFNCPNLESVSLPDDVNYLGVYAFGYDSIDADGEHQNEGFTIYANEDTLGAEYAQTYDLKLSSPADNVTPDELPEPESCVAKDLSEVTSDSATEPVQKTSWFKKNNSAVVIVIIIASCVVIFGGLYLYITLTEKKRKTQEKEETQKNKSKKKKKK